MSSADYKIRNKTPWKFSSLDFYYQNLVHSPKKFRGGNNNVGALLSNTKTPKAVFTCLKTLSRKLRCQILILFQNSFFWDFII